MSKLIRYVFGVFIIAFCSFKGYGQRRMLIPLQRYTPAPKVVQRYVQKPPHGVKPNGRRKIQAVKESFISQKLNLTTNEAKAFWPLYRKYSEELTAVKILKRINNSNSTADGAKQVDKDLEYESQLVEIKKHYRDEFYKILTPEKVSILYKSEHEFNDEALRILTERSVRAGD